MLSTRDHAQPNEAEYCGAVPEIVARTTNNRHVELEGFSETPSAEPGSESIGDESDDCWIHMLEYNPPR
jgi:hypothetical protein